MQVSYVEHPCRFYVHRAEEVSEVEKLVRHISDWANEPRNIRHLSAANLNPGYLYAGKWEKVRTRRLFCKFIVGSILRPHILLVQNVNFSSFW